MVYGGLRYGGRQHLGRYLYQCAGNGAEDGYDLYPDLLRLYLRLCGGGVYPVARVLPLEHDHHLLLSAKKTGKQGAQNGRELLPVVEDDGCGCAFLCGVHPAAPLCCNPTVARFHLFCRYRFGDDGPDMALHPTRGHQNTGVDRYVPDHLYVHGPAADYLAGDGKPGDECGGGGAGHCWGYP